jgi:hypothetical protein
MKGINLLTLGDFVFVFNYLRGESCRVLVLGNRLLSGWMPDIDTMFGELAQLPKNIDGSNANPDDVVLVAPDPATAAVTVAQEDSLLQRDRTVEGSIKALRGGLTSGSDQAIGQKNSADVARWKEADSFLFPNGLSFLKSSLPEQVGETILLIQRAQHAQVAWLVGRFNLHGQTFADTINTINHNNQVLNSALTAPTPATQHEVNLVVLRRKAQSLLSEMVPVIKRAFPGKHPPTMANLDTLLSPLNKRIAFRLLQRDQHDKKAASDQAPNAAPAASVTLG